MINNLNIILPEVFLTLSIFSILMIGVFIKKSFNLIFNLTSLIILLTIAIILNGSNDVEKVFSESFIRDAYSNFFKILILTSSLFVLNASKNFIIDNDLAKFEYPIIVLLSILGMFFMVSSNDIILFYLGLELQSLSLYILASIDRDNLKSSEAGIKYFILSALSSGLLLYGCSLLYGFTGSTNFDLIRDLLTKENTGAVFAMVFILVGLAFKVSAVPFHMWTPDVYEGAPTSITSYFAVVPKVAGLAVLIKFMFIPFSNILAEWQTIIIFISIASMILGAVAAIGQKNIKRLLAYSSIGHVGYALAGVATGVVSGYESSIVYISIYVIMNIGAFSCLYLLKKNNEYK
jgi:NADH-quinone oxidoreductase subunit N